MGLLILQRRNRPRAGQRERGAGLHGAVRRPDLDPCEVTQSWAEQNLTPFCIALPRMPHGRQPPHESLLGAGRISGPVWRRTRSTLLFPLPTVSALGSGHQRQPRSPGGATSAQHPGQRRTPGHRMAASRASCWLLWGSLCFARAALLLTSLLSLLTVPLKAAPSPVPSIQHRFTLVWLLEPG